MNGNPTGLKSLSELAAGPETIPRLRECAAYALRNIHTRESIPFLLILLDSNSRALRYEGVAGLASYANSGFIPAESRLALDGVTQLRARSTMHTNETEENFPTLETFVKDEGRYIAFWKLLIKTTFNSVQR